MPNSPDLFANYYNVSLALATRIVLYNNHDIHTSDSHVLNVFFSFASFLPCLTHASLLAILVNVCLCMSTHLSILFFSLPEVLVFSVPLQFIS